MVPLPLSYWAMCKEREGPLLASGVQDRRETLCLGYLNLRVPHGRATPRRTAGAHPLPRADAGRHVRAAPPADSAPQAVPPKSLWPLAPFCRAAGP